jgi:hypothetical protein
VLSWLFAAPVRRVSPHSSGHDFTQHPVEPVDFIGERLTPPTSTHRQSENEHRREDAAFTTSTPSLEEFLNAKQSDGSHAAMTRPRLHIGACSPVVRSLKHPQMNWRTDPLPSTHSASSSSAKRLSTLAARAGSAERRSPLRSDYLRATTQALVGSSIEARRSSVWLLDGASTTTWVVRSVGRARPLVAVPSNSVVW